MKKGRTTITVHKYDAISFIYVKVPALIVLACDPIVVAVELVRVGGRPLVGEEEALGFLMAAKIGAIVVYGGAFGDGCRCWLRVNGLLLGRLSLRPAKAFAGSVALADSGRAPTYSPWLRRR